MHIHVVNRGDTLYNLAQRYGIAVNQLARANELNVNNPLVVGQTLLVPTVDEYTVKQGETLWTIAQKLHLSHQALIEANPDLSQKPLQPGMVIKLPQKAKTPITVNGYLEPYPGNADRFLEAADALTYIAVFSYHVDEQGNLTPPDDQELLQAALHTDVRPLMVITNIKGGQFDKDVGTAVLTQNNIQERLISQVLDTLRAHNFAGLNIDFEYLGSDLKEPYNQFLRKITERLHAENYIICTSLAPKVSGTQTGEWYESHDYAAHGQIVDFVILMTYEWGWSGGPPMPVSPLTQVERVVDYALSVMPANKVVMSIPLYGYDWTLPYEPGGKFAKALNPIQATQLAQKHQVEILYDEKEAAPHFNYVDAAGKSHVVWFQDLRTLDAMFTLIKEKSLHGMSFWNLAFRFPQAWPMIQAYFTVRKS